MRMVRMHIDGLKRMVTIRGGLAASRSQNADLANLVFGQVFSQFHDHDANQIAQCIDGRHDETSIRT
jgi:hypothetical protein